MGSPPHIPTGPAAGGFRVTLHIASRMRSATLRAERAAARRSASSSSLRDLSLFHVCHVSTVTDLSRELDGRESDSGFGPRP